MWGVRPTPCAVYAHLNSSSFHRQRCGNSRIAHDDIRPVIGAVDETFLQRLMLVFMDLASGYLLLEEAAVDRTYDTWHGV